jgi:predicted metal-binding membrane protein
LHAFAGVWLLLFAASTAVTITWCNSMSAADDMPMPGGWTMSMAWMRMPGQSWVEAAASFVAMWTVMMVAMMLPAAAPALWRYRTAVARTAGDEADLRAAVAALGYFFVWSLLGVAIYPIGVALAAIEMQQPDLARFVPLTIGVIVTLAGALQFTAWKTRQLACCRDACGAWHCGTGSAWQYGFRLGLHCVYCCAGSTAVLLVTGVMDLRMMALIAAAVTLERLASNGNVAARAIGGLAVAVGLLYTAQAVGHLPLG